MKEKKQSALSRLMQIAGNHKYFSYLSVVLAVISAWVALIPFYDIWRIIKEVLEVRPDFDKAVNITSYGWQAVGFALLSMLIYIASLMCSHKAAFRVQANMRTAMMEHIMKLPLGYTKNMLMPMVCFTTASNGIFAVLIVAAYIFAGNTVTDTFVLNLIFYVLITSLITVTLMKTAYAGESQMIVEDALNRMDGVFDAPTLPEPEKCLVPSDASVNLENISFSYDESKGNAIDGISMHIDAGQHIALVGPSGGGKTTLASLIARFWDVGDGKIEIGGVNVKDIDSHKLMNHVSYVFQDSKLLKTSILENVRMGRPEATDEEVMQALTFAQCTDIIEKFPDGVNTVIGSKGIYVSEIDPEKLLSLYSIVFQDVTLFNNTVMENIRIGKKDAKDEEVMQAAKLANCIDFVECLPEKWDTMIGENGSELSGGERQRISIARAFLKDAPIILMDEATASLDVDNESAIQESISKLIENKTVLIIAHRMRTVDGVNKIVVLKDGTVAEQGSPKELKAKDGIYKHMLDTQVQSEQWKYQ